MMSRKPTWVMMFAAVALSLLGAAQVVGQESCTTDNGRWDINIDLPQSVKCTDVCASGCLAPTPANDECTKLHGVVTTNVGANTSLVAGVVTSNTMLYHISDTSQVFPLGAGAGNSLDDFAKLVFHLQAFKITSDSQTYQFDITAIGKLTYVPSTWIVKDGKNIGGCEAWGFGAPVNPFQPKVTTVTETFKDCTITIPVDPFTGPGIATVSGDPGCEIEANGEDIAALEISINGVPLGTGTFGEGTVSSGTESCTTKMIGGRLYTYGNPCP